MAAEMAKTHSKSELTGRMFKDPLARIAPAAPPLTSMATPKRSMHEPQRNSRFEGSGDTRLISVGIFRKHNTLFSSLLDGLKKPFPVPGILLLGVGVARAVLAFLHHLPPWHGRRAVA